MRKRGNISFTLLVSLVVICCGAAILNIAISSKYNSKTEYERLKNRYIAESGIDMSVGLFLNYLENQDYALAYTNMGNDTYALLNEYSPYLIDEIKMNPTLEEIEIDLVSQEVKNYLISIGYIDFKNNGEVSIKVNTFGLNESYRLCELCREPDFLISKGDEEKKSRIMPINLTIKSRYNQGEVLCNAEITNIYAVREAFRETNTGETESVRAWLDVSNAVIKYTNYQNYGGV